MNDNTKVEILVIRACKSKNFSKRLESVYKRFYYSEVDFSAICSILSSILDNNNINYSKEIIAGLSPSNNYIYIDCGYYKRLKIILCSKLRLTSVSELNNYIAPVIFRK